MKRDHLISGNPPILPRVLHDPLHVLRFVESKGTLGLVRRFLACWLGIQIMEKKIESTI